MNLKVANSNVSPACQFRGSFLYNYRFFSLRITCRCKSIVQHFFKTLYVQCLYCHCVPVFLCRLSTSRSGTPVPSATTRPRARSTSTTTYDATTPPPALRRGASAASAASRAWSVVATAWLAAAAAAFHRCRRRRRRCDTWRRRGYGERC